MKLRVEFQDQIESGFPRGLENLEKWEGIFQSGNFEQTGKVTQNTGKLWEFPTNVIH